MVEVFVKLSNHEVLFNYAVSEYTQFPKIKLKFGSLVNDTF